MAADYYSMLGVGNTATPQEIKRAFRQIARECHPDVAGDDPDAADRFKAARKAYETLMDPVTRARYDRRSSKKIPRGGDFFDAFYNHVSNQFGDEATRKTGGEDASSAPKSAPRNTGAHAAGGHPSSGGGRSNVGNDLDLDDLFKDFGDFGFGTSKRGRRRGPGQPDQPRTGAHAGEDVHIELDVPATVARDGGTVTAVYYRMQRADSWRPGSNDPGVVRIQDIADIRVMPSTRDGEVLRERGLGDAGPHGGPYGSLVVRVRVIGKAARKPDPPPPPPPPSPPPKQAPPVEEPPIDPPKSQTATDARGVTPRADSAGEATLDISLVEALLGGRVSVRLTTGKVRLTIPAGTSGGTRMRLKGKASDGGDLYLTVRIVVPKQLDDESRALIESFAELNPGDGD